MLKTEEENTDKHAVNPILEHLEKLKFITIL